MPASNDSAAASGHEGQAPEQIIDSIGAEARRCARQMAEASAARKNHALEAAAAVINRRADEILEANQADMSNAGERGLEPALKERLELNPKRVKEMSDGLLALLGLPDPIGAIRDSRVQASGIRVAKMRAPLGVVGIIFESRPGVNADAGGLCIKSGNAVILRGGSEALQSNRVIADCMRQGLKEADLPANAVQALPSADRALVEHMLKADSYIDVIVPRGGRGLIERVRDIATIPIIKHLDGVCHVYVDDEADLDMALEIAINSKCQRYGVCNAMETLLLHRALPVAWLESLAKRYANENVELRASAGLVEAWSGIAGVNVREASESDWHTEYLAPILSVRQVEGVEQAIEHIGRYGSGHTDCIVSNDLARVESFLRRVDSSSVMANTSTRFADGYQYGLGAEIGISTDRLHARGPVGLEGLTTEKYIVTSAGAVRS